jgi:hypothetical protein
MKGKKGKNGTKKYGRNKIKCERYRATKRREKNKLRNVNRHLKDHPNDVKSVKKVGELEQFIYGK